MTEFFQASVTATWMQVQYDSGSNSDDRVTNMIMKNESLKLDDDSSSDQSAAGSVVREKVDYFNQTGKVKSLVTLKVELEQLADPNGARRYSREFMSAANKLPKANIRPQFDTTTWSTDNIEIVFEKKRHPRKVKLSFFYRKI